MLKRSVVAVALAAAAVATVVACRGDRVAAPAATTTTPKGDLLGGLVGSVVNTVDGVLSVNELLPVLTRKKALDHDVKWSFVAGPAGATSRNSETGLTIVIPKGALSSNVTITVTAPAGQPVAYQFEPHGLRFAKQVQLRQDLSLTDLTAVLDLNQLAGAYYASDTLQYDPSTGLAHVDELEPTSVDLLNLSTTIKIQHFSGYVVAYGRSGQ